MKFIVFYVEGEFKASRKMVVRAKTKQKANKRFNSFMAHKAIITHTKPL